MQKTKLGVSVGLLGAALYFLGAMSLLPAMILAGYVLLFESNEWLKKATVKMVVIVITFGILSVLLGMLGDVISFMNLIIGWTGIQISFPLNLDTMLGLVLSVIENLILIIMGILALSQGSLKIGFFDKVVDKNI